MSGYNLPPGVSQSDIDRFYGYDGPDDEEDDAELEDDEREEELA